MPITIRPSVPADASDIVELLAAAGLKPNVEPEALEWKYWAEREDWTGPRSFVATRGTQILAHAAVVPGVCVTGSSRMTIFHLIDWAARPDAGGVGVSLLKYAGRLADALLAIGGSEQTRQILPHIGFQPCGTVGGYVRVLHPQRFVSASGAAKWKLPAKFARRLLWRLSSPMAAPAGWSARRIASDEMTKIAEVLPRGATAIHGFERSEGLFRYMLRCPIVNTELYAFSRNDQVCGYFLLAFALGQARVADCWVATDEAAAWQALMQFASLRAWLHRDVAELVAWSSDVRMTRALIAAGFHHRNQQPLLLRSPGPQEIKCRNLRVQMLDNDAAYFHQGFAELWA